jgi:catechol 2,3-dioxygenase-like lactoylglutathione lyase family enzyme
MMIVGSHVIVYSRDAEADRAFFRDVLKFSHVDAGGGWLIFGLPASEVAFHPADAEQSPEFYLMCEDIGAFVQAMQSRELACAPVREERWGLLTELTLPGGGKLGVYQPRHVRPPAAPVKAGRRPVKKPSPRTRKRKKTPARSKRARR